MPQTQTQTQTTTCTSSTTTTSSSVAASTVTVKDLKHTERTERGGEEEEERRRRSRVTPVKEGNSNSLETSSSSSSSSSSSVSAAEVERRRKISEAKKKNWKNPEYRTRVSRAIRGKASAAMTEKWKCETYAAKVSEGRKGTAPWNKGKRLSQEHKAKIRSAKRGSSHTKVTREKMSRSQRRRYTAARVLQSVDEIIEQQTGGGAFGGDDDSSNGSNGNSRNGNKSLTAHMDTKDQRFNMVRRYKDLLHDFRVLEGEIKPWVSQFLSEHGRKPNLSDVQATNIDWLIRKYKKYNLMKQQLLVQIPGIRGQVEKSPKDKMTDADRNNAAKLSAFFSAVSNSKAKRQKRKGENAATVWSASSPPPFKRGEVEERVSKLESMASETNNERVKAALRNVGKYRQDVLAKAKAGDSGSVRRKVVD